MEHTNPPIYIRLADERDTSAIAIVLYEAFAEYQASFTPEAFHATTPGATQIQERLSEGPVWVAYHTDALVGTVSAVPQGEGLYLRSMAVVPSARSHGVGRTLIEHVEQYALAQRYVYLILRTTPFQTSALRFYERIGFQFRNDAVQELYGTPLLTLLKPLV